MTSSMKGRICLVTGGTHGIGRETALALAGRGATLVLVGRNTERISATAQMIQDKTGNPHVDYLLVDLSLSGKFTGWWTNSTGATRNCRCWLIMPGESSSGASSVPITLK